MLYPKDFRSYYMNPDTLRISRAQFIQEMETEQWDYKMHYSIDISSQEKNWSRVCMEGSKMWNIQKEDSLEKWESDICNLRVKYDGEKCNIYVDYKGYNVIIPMGICGFEDEIQKRRIDYDINGETGNFKSLSYVISKNDLRLFCDMIYFFLSENSLDEALNPDFKY